MRSPQITLYLVLTVLKRRKFFVITPPVVVTIICICAAFLLPRKYESSTTIWVQKDEILNPLVSFSMAVQMASEDRLQTFEEIVYSRSTMEALADSLKMTKAQRGTAEWDEVMDRIKSNIRTDKNGTNSFTIRYTDSDPVRAKHSVQLLADLFIQTRLKAEYRRNEYTVKFFEGKLHEYEQSYDHSQQTVLNLLRERTEKLPLSGTSLSARFDALTEQIRENNDETRTLQRALDNIALFPGAFKTETGRMTLSELSSSEIPLHLDLREMVMSYDSVSTRYTPRFPEVAKVENQISTLLDRMKVSIRSKMTLLADNLSDLQSRRGELIRSMTETSISKQVDQETESNFTFYQQLYNEMRVKLEQARIAQELGKNAENAFIIIDPARVPIKPTKPNRVLLIVGGFAVGIILGVFCAIAAELLDTTIRSPEEINLYRKPIIALLPETGSHII